MHSCGVGVGKTASTMEQAGSMPKLKFVQTCWVRDFKSGDNGAIVRYCFAFQNIQSEWHCKLKEICHQYETPISKELLAVKFLEDAHISRSPHIILQEFWHYLSQFIFGGNCGLH
jgi:hypothetical protein